MIKERRQEGVNVGVVETNRGEEKAKGIDAGAKAPISLKVRPRLHNRIQTVMVHVSRYSFQGRARLAADVGVSRSTISRLINGQTSSSHALVQAVTDALSARLGKPLVPRDLFSPDGCYPECSGCRLCACRGCLPEAAFDSHGRRRVEWQNARPGDWSLTPQVGAKWEDTET